MIAMTSNLSSNTGRRIGVITYDYDPPIGGLGVLVRTYVQEMRKLFPEDVYTVISPSEHSDDKGPELGRLRYLKSGGCPLFSIGLFFSLSHFVAKHRFDAIHVHAGSGGVFLLRKPSCKLVVTAHHTYRQEADLVYSSAPLKRLWKLFMALLEARTYRLADAVICVSKDTADEIIAQYGIPASRVCVIENPVHVPHASSFASANKNPNCILFVGRLEPRKGVLLLLKAFEILLRDVPTAELRLVGFNMLGKRLESIIERRGLSAATTLLGYVHDPYRYRETAEASVLVVPSTLEGFGLVAAEAMTLGTCVVASDAPGLRSVVTDGVNGISFPVNDANACARALKKALTDVAYRTKLQSAAKAEAPLRFNVERRSRDVGDVYTRILRS